MISGYSIVYHVIRVWLSLNFFLCHQTFSYCMLTYFIITKKSYFRYFLFPLTNLSPLPALPYTPSLYSIGPWTSIRNQQEQRPGSWSGRNIPGHVDLLTRRNIRCKNREIGPVSNLIHVYCIISCYILLNVFVLSYDRLICPHKDRTLVIDIKFKILSIILCITQLLHLSELFSWYDKQLYSNKWSFHILSSTLGMLPVLALLTGIMIT